MSRFEQVKEKITTIHEQAAQRETAKKEALEQEEEKKRQLLEAELAERKLADENWSLLKGQVLEILEELNREALDGKGEIVGWNRKDTGVHRHSYTLCGGGVFEEESLDYG